MVAPNLTLVAPGDSTFDLEFKLTPEGLFGATAEWQDDPRGLWKLQIVQMDLDIVYGGRR